MVALTTNSAQNHTTVRNFSHILSHGIAITVTATTKKEKLRVKTTINKLLSLFALCRISMTAACLNYFHYVILFFTFISNKHTDCVNF